MGCQSHTMALHAYLEGVFAKQCRISEPHPQMHHCMAEGSHKSTRGSIDQVDLKARRELGFQFLVSRKSHGSLLLDLLGRIRSHPVRSQSVDCLLFGDHCLGDK